MTSAVTVEVAPPHTRLVCWVGQVLRVGPVTEAPRDDVCVLLNAREVAEHSLHEHRGRMLVVVGQTVVSEQMLVAWIQEQLRPIDRLHKVVSTVEILGKELLRVHPVNLNRDALRPASPEL